MTRNVAGAALTGRASFGTMGVAFGLGRVRHYLSWIEELTTNQTAGGSNPSWRTISANAVKWKNLKTIKVSEIRKVLMAHHLFNLTALLTDCRKACGFLLSTMKGTYLKVRKPKPHSM